MIVEWWKQLCVSGKPWLTSWTMEISLCLHSFFSGSRDNKWYYSCTWNRGKDPGLHCLLVCWYYPAIFLIWLIWFCTIDLGLLIPVYVLHQECELSWNPSLTNLGLSLTLMNTLLRTVRFWKHLIEEIGLPPCVFSAGGQGWSGGGKPW